MCWVMPPASPSADVGSADRVEQRRLAVVDVAHDRDHGWTVDEIVVVVLKDHVLLGVIPEVDDLDLLAELLSEQLNVIVTERLGERGELTHLHQLHDDFGDRQSEVLRHFLDRRSGVDPDRVGAGHLVFDQVLRHVFDDRAAAAATTTRRPIRRTTTGATRTTGTTWAAARGLRINHDPAFAAGAGLDASATWLGLGLVTLRALGRFRDRDDLRTHAGLWRYDVRLDLWRLRRAVLGLALRLALRRDVRRALLVLRSRDLCCRGPPRPEAGDLDGRLYRGGVTGTTRGADPPLPMTRRGIDRKRVQRRWALGDGACRLLITGTFDRTSAGACRLGVGILRTHRRAAVGTGAYGR